MRTYLKSNFFFIIIKRGDKMTVHKELNISISWISIITDILLAQGATDIIVSDIQEIAEIMKESENRYIEIR